MTTTVVPNPLVASGSGDETLMRPVSPAGLTFLFAAQIKSGAGSGDAVCAGYGWFREGTMILFGDQAA